MTKVLGLTKAMGGRTAGISDDGGAALVITSLPILPVGGARRARTRALPKGILLLPVKDYRAFLGNFGVQDTAPGAVDRFMNMLLFAKQVGDFAVISNERQQVASYKSPTGSEAILARTGHFGKQILTHSISASVPTLSVLVRSSGR